MCVCVCGRVSMNTYVYVCACVYIYVWSSLLILTIIDCKCRSALTTKQFFIKTNNVRINKICDAGWGEKVIFLTSTSKNSTTFMNKSIPVLHKY